MPWQIRAKFHPTNNNPLTMPHCHSAIMPLNSVAAYDTRLISTHAPHDTKPASTMIRIGRTTSRSTFLSSHEQC